MGNGNSNSAANGKSFARDRITTAILVLVLLDQNHPNPMTTYELGLWITDNQTPPRPLSIIIKTLASDGYIARAAFAGKRAALWIITERGASSLSTRPAKRDAAIAWLNENPGYSRDEIAVMNNLLFGGNQSPTLLSENCSLPISPIRTALKKLILRKMVSKPRNPVDGYALTSHGRSLAGKMRKLKIAGSTSSRNRKTPEPVNI